MSVACSRTGGPRQVRIASELAAPAILQDPPPRYSMGHGQLATWYNTPQGAPISEHGGREGLKSPTKLVGVRMNTGTCGSSFAPHVEKRMLSTI
eukprot:scaffold223321_cov32-Tisochrysis_lutea.AAC.5